MQVIPSGAKPIIEARKQGKKPADLIIVSTIGKTEDLNPTLYVNDTAEYDWRFIRGLSLCLYVNSKTNWKPLAAAICAHKPTKLLIWDVDRFEGCEVYALPSVEDIEKPIQAWRWKLHFLPWLECENKEFQWGLA